MGVYITESVNLDGGDKVVCRVPVSFLYRYCQLSIDILDQSIERCDFLSRPAKFKFTT